MLTKLIILMSLCPVAAYACESGQSIDAVIDGGTIIKLDDGSIWEVSSYDRSTASTWTSSSDVLICDDDKLVNVDDNESVDVKKLK